MSSAPGTPIPRPAPAIKPRRGCFRPAGVVGRLRCDGRHLGGRRGRRWGRVRPRPAAAVAPARRGGAARLQVGGSARLGSARLCQDEEASLGAGHLQPPLREASGQPRRRFPLRHQPALDLVAGGDLGQRGWHGSVSVPCPGARPLAAGVRERAATGGRRGLVPRPAWKSGRRLVGLGSQSAGLNPRSAAGASPGATEEAQRLRTGCSSPARCSLSRPGKLNLTKAASKPLRLFFYCFH